MKEPWWVKLHENEVPWFFEAKMVNPFADDGEAWYFAREQLWAMREGLA